MNALRTIQGGIGLALVAAFGLAVCPAAADTDIPGPPPPVGLRCTVSSGSSPTGREWARLVIVREREDQVICSRVRLGGPAPNDFPSCYARRDELGCTIIID